MTSITSIVLCVVVAITLPIIILFWLTETKQQKVIRMRNNGTTYKTIAERLKVSQTTARRYYIKGAK